MHAQINWSKVHYGILGHTQRKLILSKYWKSQRTLVNPSMHLKPIFDEA